MRNRTTKIIENKKIVRYLAALVQASRGSYAYLQLPVFSPGALLMRSAGSTVNDIADRKFDARVGRTSFRPLAGGQLQIHEALAFLIIELGLAASLLSFTPFIRMAAVCVLPLVLFVSFASDSPTGPKVVLGAAFNGGMAWAEMAGNNPAGAFVMWIGVHFWHARPSQRHRERKLQQGEVRSSDVRRWQGAMTPAAPPTTHFTSEHRASSS
jgi:4-hydroxybenzoate polyprenyltransferase